MGTTNRMIWMVSHFPRFLWVTVWLLGRIVWPVANRIIGVFMSYKLLQIIFYWNDANVHAGWSFVGYLAGYVALTWLFTYYRPR